MPSLRALYYADFTIRRALTPMIMGLMLAIGIWWVVKPMPNAVPTAELSTTALYAPWISAGVVVLAVFAGAVVVRRYLLVRKIHSHGVCIRGTVEAMDRHDTNMHSNTSRMETGATYVYYVTIRYAVHGIERTIRLRLPHSFGTYGIKEGGEVDLLVLEWMPQKPIIRAVYQERSGGRDLRL